MGNLIKIRNTWGSTEKGDPSDLSDEVEILCTKGLETRYGEEEAAERIGAVASRLDQAVDGASVAEALVAVGLLRRSLVRMYLTGGVLAAVEEPVLKAGQSA